VFAKHQQAGLYKLEAIISLPRDPLMPDTRELTAKQRKALKKKLLNMKGFRVSEIERIAKVYAVSVGEVRKALRIIRKSLTKKEAAKLRLE
jgi:hypothetical protein